MESQLHLRGRGKYSVGARDEMAGLCFAGDRGSAGWVRIDAGDFKQSRGVAAGRKLRTADLGRYTAAPEAILLPLMAEER